MAAIILVGHSSTESSILAELIQRFTHDAMEGLWPEVRGSGSPEQQGNVRVLKRVRDLVPPGDTDLQR